MSFLQAGILPGKEGHGCSFSISQACSFLFSAGISGSSRVRARVAKGGEGPKRLYSASPRAQALALLWLGRCLWERKDSLSLMRFFKGSKTIFPTVSPTVSTTYSSFDKGNASLPVSHRTLFLPQPVVSLVSLEEEVSTSGIASGLPSMASQSAAPSWYF